MPQDAVRVDSAALDAFHDHLANGTVAELGRVASGVHRLNGGDVNAFGVFFAQVLGIPSRIAMATAAGHLDDLTQQMAELAKNVKDTADAYDQVEQTNAKRAHGLLGS